MESNRRSTRGIYADGLQIGNGAPISVQSMTNTQTTDVESTVTQVVQLETAGCQLVRIAIPNLESVSAFAKIKMRTNVPLCADIHFDHRLALGAIDAGADKIRINPGNIGSSDRIAAVAQACLNHKIPLRVGVNAGSVSKALIAKHGSATVPALIESAAENIRMLNDCGFDDICLSIKASDVQRTIQANLEAADTFPYPLHIGVTEAGIGQSAILRSAIGIGGLLAMGVGDTIRVSLTGDPVAEVAAGFDILRAVGLMHGGIDIISCPTCGRCNVDLEQIAAKVKEAVSHIATDKNIKIAIMGCAVNGPGEAREADIGLAGGKGEFLLFADGETVCKVSPENAVNVLLQKLHEIV